MRLFQGFIVFLSACLVTGVSNVDLLSYAASNRKGVAPSYMLLTPSSYNARISQKRAEEVAAVVLCNHPKPPTSKKATTPSNECTNMLAQQWETVAKELAGAITMGAVDCTAHESLCKSVHPEGISPTAPTVIVIPKIPAPSYVYNGEVSVVALKKEFIRYFPADGIMNLDNSNMEGFLTSFAVLPKALLFTDKKTAPFVFRAVAKRFASQIKFGLVPHSEKDLVARYKIKTFPQLLVIRPGQKQEMYKDEMSYMKVFDWLNVYSETFAMNSTEEHTPSLMEKKPWKFERIPEVTADSYGDVCFSKKNGICVIYLKGTSPITEVEISMLEGLRDRYRSNLADRGTEFFWMWMNIGLEPNYKEFFGVQTIPSLVVVKPNTRRFTGLDSSTEASQSVIEKLLEDVLSGGMRFKSIKNLPRFADRSKAESLKKEEL